MSKTLRYKGRHTILPIVGDTLVGLTVELSRGPELIFRSPEGEESLLKIEDPVIAVTRGEELRLNTFEARGLSPILELVGLSILEATALETGELLVVFVDQSKLTICSTTGYEAWHYSFPRPGHPPSGPVGKHIGLTGAAGRLI